MANVTVSFLPTRKLTDPPPDIGAPYELTFEVRDFTESVEARTSSSTSLSGRERSQLFYYRSSYQVTTAIDMALDPAEMEMFLYSTMNKEEFVITNPREGDREMLVKVVNMFTKTPVGSSVLNRYTYSFSVNEVL